MIHLDYETFSPLDITEVGAFKYAEHPDAEILMAAVAGEDGEPMLLVNPKYENVRASDPGAMKLLVAALPTDRAEVPEEIWAHNAQFEMAISRARLWRDFGLECPAFGQWRCTALLCRRAGFAPKLEKACEQLGLPPQKDTRGKALIRKFCVLDKHGKRTLPQDDPAGFKEFCDYCIQDVRAERALHAKLKAFTPRGELLEAFTFDLRLNARGFPVDVPALEIAHTMVEEVQKEVGEAFHKLTGLLPSQRARCLEWFVASGISMDDLQAATVTATLEKTPNEALRLYASIQSAAVGKIETMLDAVCEDGRVRGGLQFHGASTGRWSGRLVQPQNFKKPKRAHGKSTHAFYADMKAGMPRAHLEALYGNPVDWLASSIRHFLSGPLLDADYASIEARIVAWLSGQDDLLEIFRGDGKVYEWLGGQIFGIPKEQIANPSYERDAGKAGILGCGYQMWWPRLQDWAKTMLGLNLTDDQAKEIVLGYRERCYKVVELWEKIDTCARSAIVRPGEVFSPCAGVYFTVRAVEEVLYLLIRLPSGRSLAYPYPKLEPNPKRKGEIGITFFGQIPLTQQWGRVSTFPGALLENCLAKGTEVLTDSGWKPIEAVALRDRVWDGEEWVRHEGLLYQGDREVIELNGVRLTPDHIVFAASGKVSAEKALQGQQNSSQNPIYLRTSMDVYDLKNAGPRHRFLVRGRTGTPMLVSNCVQGIAFDLMAHGALVAERAGFEIVNLIHDQALALRQEGQNPDAFAKALTDLPSWARGLPLAADAKATPYYAK